MASSVSVVDVELAESLAKTPVTQREARRLVVDYYRRLGQVLRSLAIGADQRQPAVLTSPEARSSPDVSHVLQSKLDQLSDREREVLARLMSGDNEKQAAIHLKISRHTVHDHVKQLYRRLEVSSRGELLSLFVTRRP